MRKRAGWMNSAAVPILELLDEWGLAIPTGAIYYNLSKTTDVSKPTVTRAIKHLSRAEMIEKPRDAKTYYRITDDGSKFLDGTLDSREIDLDVLED